MQGLKKKLKLLVESSKPKLGYNDCTASLWHAIRGRKTPDNWEYSCAKDWKKKWKNVEIQSSITNWRDTEGKMFNIYIAEMAIFLLRGWEMDLVID